MLIPYTITLPLSLVPWLHNFDGFPKGFKLTEFFCSVCGISILFSLSSSYLVTDQRCEISNMGFTEFACVKGGKKYGNYLASTKGKTAEECRAQCDGLPNCLVGNWYAGHDDDDDDDEDSVCNLFKRDDKDLKTCSSNEEIQEKREDAELIRCSTKSKSSRLSKHIRSSLSGYFWSKTLFRSYREARSHLIHSKDNCQSNPL